jgi:multiple sugar transport system ATP-binding protein
MDLRLQNLSKHFGDKLAVEIPELVIHAGEFFTFVGPSGCGKSTTLNLIAGLEAPSAGALYLGDRRLNELPPHKRDVAFVFQTYALYPHRTVRENLAFPLELAGRPREEIRRRVEQTAEWLNITALLEKRPRQLSGGERQRVALGRAMVRQPQLFLFDEPLSNLDAPLRAQMRKELKRLHTELRTTFIYVTHDQEEALSLSDRIAVLHAGRIHQCATPREIYEQPVNTFVAGFFGSPAINFQPGAVAAEAGSLRLRIGTEHLRMDKLPPGLVGTERLVLGVRPEHVQVSREKSPAAWRARVTLVELHGGQSYLELEAAGVRWMAVGQADAGYRAGDTVWLELIRDRLHFFELESGVRLEAGPAAALPSGSA